MTHRRFGELGDELLMASAANGASQLQRLHQRLKGLSQVARVPRCRKHAGPTVFDELRRAATVDCDDRDGTRHCLQKCDAEPLPLSRADQDIHTLDTWARVIDLACHRDLFPKREFADQWRK